MGFAARTQAASQLGPQHFHDCLTAVVKETSRRISEFVRDSDFQRFASSRIPKSSVSLTEDSPSIMQLGRDAPKPSHCTKGSRCSCATFKSAPLNAKDAERLPLRSKVWRRSGRAASERASEPCDEDGLRVALPSVRAGIIEAVSWLLLWCSEGLILILC